VSYPNAYDDATLFPGSSGAQLAPDGTKYYTFSFSGSIRW
jgi:hypothetical protein